MKNLNSQEIVAKTHRSVLLAECLSGLAIIKDGVYIDATFGRGGHSLAILELLQNGKLIAIDRDPQAQTYANEHFNQSNQLLNCKQNSFIFCANTMSELENISQYLGVLTQIDGILMDIGVSSPQLDDPLRGFSFSKDGPLDMRMDTRSGISAMDWIATTDAKEMARVFSRYGEEKFAMKIAFAIENTRIQTPITRTLQLAEIIAAAMPFKDKHKHPATRCFQAIRIEVNNELKELAQGLDAALNSLKIGGRLVVISFHSLEDRIVKQFMRSHATKLDLMPNLPVPVYANEIRLKLIGKPIKASILECEQNPRARSAILRIAEKIK
ncbi:16S rRNA m(4)C1402 methyltransferase [Gammaproteobacteria bacterium]|nr:16S rRNA m(4)C1402 methyltransferase [Gammaproteobacteria bacterium]